MGARCLLLLALASGLAPVCAAEAWAAAARSEAEVDAQQECEHAAARVEALQTRSTLTAEPQEEHRAAEDSLPDDACHQCANATAAEEKEELAKEPLYAGMGGNQWVPGPNIYLANMVDGKNYRSYCMDIAGSPPYPQCTTMQAHTCKTEGEDTQFMYNTKMNQIWSANFNAMCEPLYSGSKNGREWEASDQRQEGCLTVSGDITAGATLGLTHCTEVGQTFVHTERGQFRVGDTSYCLVVGEEAKVFDSDWFIRSLEIQDCESWPVDLSQWEVLKPDHSVLGERHLRRTLNATESDSSQTE